MLSGITWCYTAQKLRNGKLINKSQGTQHARSDKNYKACFNTRAPYILYEKDCAILAKMMKPLVHINNLQQWPSAFYLRGMSLQRLVVRLTTVSLNKVMIRNIHQKFHCGYREPNFSFSFQFSKHSCALSWVKYNNLVGVAEHPLRSLG